MNPIHLFRSDIKEGQVFIAHIDTIEGHDRVTLVPDNDYYERQENPEAFEDDSFNDMDGDEELSCINHEDSMDFGEMEEQELLDRQEEILASEEA